MDKIIYLGGQFIDPYFNAFMNRTIYQPICYHCPFAGTQRVGDLTTGDFWGLSEEITSSHGVNMVLVNNANGERLLNSIQDRITLIQRPIGEAINGNDTLCEPTQRPKEYEDLINKIMDVGFIRALDMYEEGYYEKRVSAARSQWTKYRIKRFVKRFIPTSVLRRLKHR